VLEVANSGNRVQIVVDLDHSRLNRAGKFIPSIIYKLIVCLRHGSFELKALRNVCTSTPIKLIRADHFMSPRIQQVKRYQTTVEPALISLLRLLSLEPALSRTHLLPLLKLLTLFLAFEWLCEPLRQTGRQHDRVLVEKHTADEVLVEGDRHFDSFVSCLWYSFFLFF
jgi:hypothetical protein